MCKLLPLICCKALEKLKRLLAETEAIVKSRKKFIEETGGLVMDE